MPQIVQQLDLLVVQAVVQYLLFDNVCHLCHSVRHARIVQLFDERQNIVLEEGRRVRVLQLRTKRRQQLLHALTALLLPLLNEQDEQQCQVYVDPLVEYQCGHTVEDAG